jgi:hypothetical protein
VDDRTRGCMAERILGQKTGDLETRTVGVNCFQESQHCK